ncbi:MAG: MoaD/ThiS family protein [Alphaproteobacteria bacterium]
MARVFVSGSIAGRLTGGQTEFEVKADTVGRLVRELDRRFPGIGDQIEESMAVAIDGVICQDTLLEPIPPDAEIHLIPKIAGG